MNRKALLSGMATAGLIALVLAGTASAHADARASEHPEPQATSGPDPAAIEAEASEQGSALSPTYDELSKMDGFDSGGLYPGTTDLSIYWHGGLSADAKASIERAEAHGQHVHVVTVRYSSQQIWNFATDLMKAIEPEQISIAGFSTNRANNEISVSGPKLSVDPNLQKRVLAIAAEVVPDDVTVTFVPAELNVGGYAY